MARTKQTARKSVSSPKKTTRAPAKIAKSPVKKAIKKSPRKLNVKTASKQCSPIVRVRNAKTNRCVRVGSRRYMELVKSGDIRASPAKEVIQEKLDMGVKVSGLSPKKSPAKKAKKSPAKKATKRAVKK